MIGTRSILHPWGGPWAGGTAEAFEQSAVRAFGKLSRWGDGRVYYMVCLVDGAELFVDASKQEASDEKWIRRLGAMSMHHSRWRGSADGRSYGKRSRRALGRQLPVSLVPPRS